MYASFCRRQRRGEFDLVNRDELWGLLVRITLCKMRNTANRHRRKRRDIAREVACQTGHEPGALSFDLAGIKARGPGPCEAAALNEGLNRGWRASRFRASIPCIKKLEGWTNAEIATSIGRTERCVERRTEADPRVLARQNAGFQAAHR